MVIVPQQTWAIPQMIDYSMESKCKREKFVELRVP
jgi:hypothetical protein